MNYHKHVANFCAGLACLQAYNGPPKSRNISPRIPIELEDGDLIWAFTNCTVGEQDHDDLVKLGWETEDGRDWSFRLHTDAWPPGYKCPDRLKSEREVAELFANY